ncbi:MAG: hypothetical protein ABI687_03595 [Flavitalea sp.]
MKRTCNRFSVLMALLVFIGRNAGAQSSRIDSLFMNSDTTSIIDSLLKDFDAYLDSLSKPRSFFNVSLTAGTGIFSFEDKSSVFLNPEKKLILSPSAGYYHKSGLGLSATGALINDEGTMRFYQFTLSPSFDVVRKNFSSGIVYSKFFNKDSLNFYTTPVSNELFAYFSLRKWKVRPSVNISYGWGSNTDYEKRKLRIAALALRRSRNYSATIKNEEKVSDFSMTFSVKKDFNWYEVIGKKDHIVFTPALLVNTGTQRYGFNSSYINSNIASYIRVSQNPGNSSFSSSTGFLLQSVSMALRGSYMTGKCLLQPQVMFDYYVPETDIHFNTFFSITAGFVL